MSLNQKQLYEAVYKYVTKRLNEREGSWEDVVLFIKNCYDTWKVIEWMANACAKKKARGITLDKNQLVNSSTVKKLCSMALNLYQKEFDITPRVSRDEKLSIRDAIADNVLEFAEELVNKYRKESRAQKAYSKKIAENILNRIKSGEKNEQTNGRLKQVKLTESSLNKLIEQSINELDWKTYMNAAKKAADRAAEHEDDKDQEYHDNSWRKRAFRDAAEKSYMQKHNANKDNNGRIRSLSDGWYEEEDTPNEDIWYGITDTYFPSMDNDDTDVESEYGENYDSNVFEVPERNRHFSDNLRPYSEEELNTLSPEFRDVHNYHHGKSRYTKGKGWNESVARRVTDGIIKKLKESLK